MNDAVFRLIADRVGAGDQVFLLTVVETFGSSPRPPGAALALCRDDNGKLRSVGSVSGGCIEAELLQYLVSRTQPDSEQLSMPAYAAETVYYGSDDGGIVDSESPNVCFDLDGFKPPSGSALPCGGRLRLLVERFSGDEGAARHFKRILQSLNTRESLVRRVDTVNQRYDLLDDPSHPEVTATSNVFSFHLQPAWRLVLIGANEVSRRVCELSLDLGFEVSVCEPRDWFYSIAAESAEWKRMPSETLVRTLPDDLVESRFSDGWSAVLALGHDPRIDDMALLSALQSRAFYVGAMGSERTSAARRARLLELGVSHEQLATLDAPAGVDIGSRTPAEIAIACVASLIASRNAARQVAGQLARKGVDQ